MPIAKEAVDTDAAPRKVKPATTYRVRALTQSGVDPVIYRHEDKGAARRYVEIHHPRGMEVYVEHPDGYREHFSADQAFGGHSNEGWNELREEDLEQ